MRTPVVVTLLSLSVLSACAGPQHILSEVPAVEGAPAHYTNHPSTATQAKVVKLGLDPAFTEEERAEITASAREWNVALNGAVRFDVRPTIAGSDWSIASSPQYYDFSRRQSPQPLTANLRLGKDRGLIVVYVNRIRDPSDGRKVGLRGVMVNALGWALGGGNGSTLYTDKVENCITRDMVMSVGAVQAIPLEQLNWCEPNATVAAR